MHELLCSDVLVNCELLIMQCLSIVSCCAVLFVVSCCAVLVVVSCCAVLVRREHEDAALCALKLSLNGDVSLQIELRGWSEVKT